VPQRSKPWCNALEALNLKKNTTTKPSEWERGEGEIYKGVWTFQSAKRASSTPVLEYIYSPFTSLAIMGKTRNSRTVRDALADCLRLNSNGKNAKSTAGETDRWTGRTVRQDPADCAPGPRGLSAGRPRTVRPVHRVAPCSVKNNGPSAWGSRTVRLEAHFLENFCQNSQILNKYQKLADCLPQGPRLSAQHLKTDFS
jgi:hypothetical protein